MSDLKTRLKNGPVAMPGYDYYGHPERVYAEDEADILFSEAADRIEEIPSDVLDAASAYLEEQYGYTMLSNPVDRARIMEKLK